MPYEKSTTGMGDLICIDVYNPGELSYWTMALHVSDEDLKRAVAEVGPMVGDVCRKLHGNTIAESQSVQSEPAIPNTAVTGIFAGVNAESNTLPRQDRVLPAWI